MKNRLISALIIFLTITSSVGFVQATNENEEKLINETSKEEEKINMKNESDRIGEKVRTPTGGSKNVSFEDGYNGYCINKGWGAADAGDTFTVRNTSMATNSLNNEYIGNYLKILFVDYHDFAINDKDETAKIIWNFSDRNYEASDDEIIKGILAIAESGRVIPDHGEVKKINNTTEAIFDFEVLDSQGKWDQNFFGYRITYREIINEIVNNTPDESINEIITPDNNQSVNEIINNTQESNESSNYTPNETQEKSNATKIYENNNTLNTTGNSTENNINMLNNTQNNSNQTSNTTTPNSNDEKPEIDMSKTTGNPLFIILLVLISVSILKLKNRRD